jgi:hypothetical protein
VLTQHIGYGIIIGIGLCSLFWAMQAFLNSVENKSVLVPMTGLNLSEGFTIYRSLRMNASGSPVFYEVRYHDILVCRIPFLTHKPRDTVDGVRFEDLIAIIIERYRHIQKGDYANPHNSIILELLRQIQEEQLLALAHIRASAAA